LPGQATALFGDFIEGRWEQARRKLHEDMRGHVDIVGRVADGWADPASPWAVPGAWARRLRGSSAITPWLNFR
jgi:hypothetical protein